MRIRCLLQGISRFFNRKTTWEAQIRSLPQRGIDFYRRWRRLRLTNTHFNLKMCTNCRSRHQAPQKVLFTATENPRTHTPRAITQPHPTGNYQRAFSLSSRPLFSRSLLNKKNRINSDTSDNNLCFTTVLWIPISGRRPCSRTLANLKKLASMLSSVRKSKGIQWCSGRKKWGKLFHLKTMGPLACSVSTCRIQSMSNPSHHGHWWINSNKTRKLLNLWLWKLTISTNHLSSPLAWLWGPAM